MPLPSTMTPIATNTLSSSSNSLTFSNIPQTYTDLILIVNAKASGAQDVVSRINSDSGSNYSTTFINGTGSAANSGRQSNQTYLYIDNYGYLETTDGQVSITHFMNYANSTTNKTILSRASNASNGVTGLVGLWRNTSAITSITLYCGIAAATFSSGSTFTLYGVKAA
jgi:hypothetical protein